MSEILDAIKWDANGLVPAIAQNYRNGRVLMLAWMNREALELTMAEERAVYWSRSRQKIWRKGEESGHIQIIKEIRLDCDNDVILLKVKQVGGIACHTGRERCFYKKYADGKWVEDEKPVKSQRQIYHSRGSASKRSDKSTDKNSGSSKQKYIKRDPKKESLISKIVRGKDTRKKKP